MKTKRVLLLMALSVVVTLLSLSYFHVVQLSSGGPNPFNRIRHKESSTFHHPPSPALRVSNSIESDCLSGNSKKWLNAERLGNLRDDRLDPKYLQDTIIDVQSWFANVPDPLQRLLNQTLCHQNSLLLSTHTTSRQEMMNPANDTIHIWSVRLIYLATHIHQHIAALEEAKQRGPKVPTCQVEWESRGIGPLDFECPSAKFLVVSLGRLGLGAVMRLGVVNALIAGIACNRTVVVVNNSPVGPKFLQEPWLLSSCPRRDMQCFYMPLTPCVITREEIINATTLQRGQVRALFRHGRLPESLENERVVLMDLNLRPQRTPYAFRQGIVMIIEQYILEPLRQQQSRAANLLLSLLTKSAKYILEEEQLENGSYYYFGHNSKHNHALVFYAMRPNPNYSVRLQEIVRDFTPRHLDPESTFGVPIRASDKCDTESECMPFHQYMNMTRYTFFKFQRELEQAMPEHLGAKANIIVTSEATQVRDEMATYLQHERHLHELPFTARFISNNYDLHQGTGNPARTSSNISMDEVMLSAVSSLKLQINAKYTLGNCCSNFHNLLFDFLRDGCGAARQQIAECMQDHEDPSFRLCCHWSKDKECMAKRAIQNYNQGHNSTIS